MNSDNWGLALLFGFFLLMIIIPGIFIAIENNNKYDGFKIGEGVYVEGQEGEVIGIHRNYDVKLQDGTILKRIEESELNRIP